MANQLVIFEGDEPPDYYEDDIDPGTCDCERCQPASIVA